MGYLKNSNEFWTDVDPNLRPRKSLKYNQIYQFIYALTNDRPTGSGKSTPKRLSLSATADDEPIPPPKTSDIFSSPD